MNDRTLSQCRCNHCGELISDEKLNEACRTYLEMSDAAWTAAMYKRVAQEVELYKKFNPNMLDAERRRTKQLEQDLVAARAIIADISLPWYKRWFK